jgi:hypothetical protein
MTVSFAKHKAIASEGCNTEAPNLVDEDSNLRQIIAHGTESIHKS